MDELFARFFGDLDARIGGPMTFRLILQPAMATYLAIRAGVADALGGRSPYLWTILTSPGERRGLLSEGWKAVARVFVFSIIMDFVYQLWVLHWFYPLQALAVAVLLACVPYMLVRGLANRITRARHRLH